MNQPVIKYIIFFTAITFTIYGQDNRLLNEYNIYNDVKPEADKPGKTVISREEESRTVKYDEVLLNRYTLNLQQGKKSEKEIQKLDIVSAFRSNIRFGGFWENYAIVNFTPDMYLKPNDFISFYASHNMSYFVPLNGIKENFKSMAIQGAAILAIENSIRIFTDKRSIPVSIISFLLKNAVLMVMKKDITAGKKENVLLNRYYFYSVNIRF